MEQNHRNTKKSNGCLGWVAPHPAGKRASPKSISDIKELVSGSSKWHARPHRKGNDKNIERLCLEWKQERVDEAGLYSQNKRKRRAGNTRPQNKNESH